MLLARHGETEWNVEGRWQGHSDSPLTPRGHEQARLLAEALAGEPLTAVYASDIGRSYRTAEPVAARHGLEPIADPRLRELDAGSWTGRLGRELQAEDPEGMDAWRFRPWAHQMPDGETLAEAQARALKFLSERLPRHAGETVAVISHGAVAQCVLAAALGRPLEALWLKEGKIENCQVSRLEWTQQGGLRVAELADTRHLAAVGGLAGWRIMGQETEQGS